MNLLQKLSTSTCALQLVVGITLCFINTTQAQKQYTTILKNINPEAQNLYHDLSPQGDTLYLKAESIFYKVKFLNSFDKKDYTFNPPVLEGKIPLHDIIIGDYTVLVYKKDRIIVFHISRLLDIEKPLDMIASNTINKDLKIQGDIVSMEDLHLAISNNNPDNGEASIQIKPYNISNLNRYNMESRYEYRRNNVRPNGKSYF